MTDLSPDAFDKIFGEDPCFCESGLKYKECHRLKVYHHPNEITADQRQFSHRSRECHMAVNGEKCPQNTVSSHSQQRNGTLNQIAEAGHVLGFSNGPNVNRHHDGPLDLIAVSARKASTFPGLCNHHDTIAFKEIEAGTLVPNYRVAINLAIRCAFYEAVIHTDAALFLSWLRHVPNFSFHIDLKSQEQKLENMRHYSGYNWDLLKLLLNIKSKRSPRKLYFFSCLLDVAQPFSATGCFCIENDLHGRKLQPFSQKGRKFSYAQISVLPQRNGTTLLTISSTSDMDRIASIDFIQSFKTYSRNGIANAFLRAAIQYTENIYFQPSWINNPESMAKSLILERSMDDSNFSIGDERPGISLSRPLDISLFGEATKSSSNI